MKFLNCTIDASKKVFRPRIETEFWVKEVLASFTPNVCDVLDIFAGTGCIGIAVLKNIKNSQVDFVDISPQALSQIKINLKLNKIAEGRYRIIKSNIFSGLRGKGYDFIFANPPYVAEKRMGEVQKEVLEKDPKMALFSGKDGMDAIEIFLNDAGRHLKFKGRIFMEFDPFQREEIEKLLRKNNFSFFFKKDQFNKIRWLIAEK
jgi:release factor glutamine methyltransferase